MHLRTAVYHTRNTILLWVSALNTAWESKVCTAPAYLLLIGVSKVSSLMLSIWDFRIFDGFYFLILTQISFWNVCAYICTSVYAHFHVWAQVCVHIHVCMCVPLCVCVQCTYTHVEIRGQSWVSFFRCFPSSLRRCFSQAWNFTK